MNFCGLNLDSQFFVTLMLSVYFSDELCDQHCHQHLNRNHQNGTSAHDSPRKEEDQLQKLPIIDEEGGPQDSHGSGSSSGSVNSKYYNAL